MSEMDGDGGSKIESAGSTSDVTPAAKEAGEGVPAVPSDQPVTPANDTVPQQGTEQSGQSVGDNQAAPVEPGEGTPPAEANNQDDGSGLPDDVKAQADAAVASSISFFSWAEASPDRAESNLPATDPKGKGGRGR